METNKNIIEWLSIFQILDDIHNPTYREVWDIREKIMNCLTDHERKDYESMRPYQQKRFMRNKFLYILSKGKCNWITN